MADRRAPAGTPNFNEVTIYYNTTGWLDPTAFARPSGRGDFGNMPRVVFRQPGVNNWNLALFKNFGLGGLRTFQLRLEAYNVLNAVQFEQVFNDLRFDEEGNQINSNFGKASDSRNPRTMQVSLRMTF